ncbi:MAG: AzlC family ABC transporter permease [Acidimicrobiales bacterium]|nr:AzlC family ABC transporter permease [Acidimicrobiales bacterium]
MPDTTLRRTAIKEGVAAAAPMLIGVVPFGLVAGASAVAADFGFGEAMGLSGFVFAGASQLAIINALDDGATVVIAIITALTINLRMLLYSASLAPRLAHEPLPKRLVAAFFLVDQAYALSIVRWTGRDDPRARMPFYFAVGITLGTSWLTATAVGALVGSSVPDDVPLEFAIPLVFLVLLVPVLERWPAVVAAAVGGAGAVLAAELGAERLAIVIGGVLGIIAGALADARRARTGGEASS